MIQVNSEVQLTKEVEPVQESLVVEGIFVKLITNDMIPGERGVSLNIQSNPAISKSEGKWEKVRNSGVSK